MRREIVAVDDMQYEHSDVGLERQLSRFPGVVRVDIHPRAGFADITYEESRITSRGLHDLIAQCGYSLPRADARTRHVPPAARASEQLEAACDEPGLQLR